MSLFSHLKSGPGLLTAAVMATSMLSGIAHAANPANLVITEVFFDPSGSGDDNEYIELRSVGATTETSLDGYYLVFLENEAPNAGAGQPGYGYVEAVFNLGQLANGSAGYTNSSGLTVILPKGNTYGLTAGTGVYVNTGSGAGYGYAANGASTGSTIGFTQENGVGNAGHIENSGFTALLIHVDSGSVVPTVGQNFDGTDHILTPQIGASWTLVDSIGVQAESDETSGVLYGAINFAAEMSGNISFSAMGPVIAINDATYGVTNFTEIEYVGRWGNSTATSDFGDDEDNQDLRDDWYVANLKKNGPPYVMDFESGSYQGVMGGYGTALSSYFTGSANDNVTTPGTTNIP